MRARALPLPETMPSTMPKLKNSASRIFIPDGTPGTLAFSRITHLGIGAHQDDLEFMAFHGIITCFHSDSEWFGGVTCTDGAGCSRTGSYADRTDEEMREIRIREQEAAAMVGRFGAMVQLGYPSAEVRDAGNSDLKSDIAAILSAARPKVVYTHNPADKHDTHIGVFFATIQALREMPLRDRPDSVYGCEVWRGLDWMLDGDKVALNVGGHDSLAAALNGIFDSQIAGGKRYDLATVGRQHANATFFDAHSADPAERLSFAMDLTPLIAENPPDIMEYVLGYVRRFEEDIRCKLAEGASWK